MVADFHLRAETNDHIRSFGKVEQIRAAFDENYEQTSGYIGGPQTQQQFDETKALHRQLFSPPQEALFQKRIEQDWIRACHTAHLHLNNIAYWQDQLYLFDCNRVQRAFPLCGCDVRRGLCGDGLAG